jgi:hypothetical protein
MEVGLSMIKRIRRFLFSWATPVDEVELAKAWYEDTDRRRQEAWRHAVEHQLDPNTGRVISTNTRVRRRTDELQ